VDQGVLLTTVVDNIREQKLIKMSHKKWPLTIFSKMVHQRLVKCVNVTNVRKFRSLK